MSAPTPFFAAAALADRAMRAAGVCTEKPHGVLLALSGGADSVYLLYTLLELSRRRPLRLEAMHVEHGIRGEESRSDAAFCEELCRTLGVPFTVRCVNVPREREQTGEGIEEAARRLRYGVLEAYRAERALDYIAVAHNETDQAETVLYHLLRGSGARGLTGMQVMSGRLLRPLLGISSEQIRSELREAGIAFRLDSTNLDTAYTRNYLRQTVFPALKRVTPEPSHAIARAAALIWRDLSALDRMADAFYADEERRTHRPSLAALEPALLSRVLIRLFRSVGAEMPSAVHIDAAVAQIKRGGISRVSCPSGITLEIGRERIAFLSGEREPLPETLLQEGVTVLRGREAEMALFNSASEKELPHSLIVYKKSNKALISSAKIIGKLFVREARRGDSYRFGGMTRSLSKLFSSRRLGDRERRTLPVVCDDAGILWVPGFGVSERADGRGMPESETLTLLYLPDNEKGQFHAQRHFGDPG